MTIRDPQTAALANKLRRIRTAPGVAKARVRFSTAGTLRSGTLNVSSISGISTGVWQVNFATDFSSSNSYSVFVTADPDLGTDGISIGVEASASGSSGIQCVNSSTGAVVDPVAGDIHFAAFGDQ